MECKIKKDLLMHLYTDYDGNNMIVFNSALNNPEFPMCTIKEVITELQEENIIKTDNKWGSWDVDPLGNGITYGIDGTLSKGHLTKIGLDYVINNYVKSWYERNLFKMYLIIAIAGSVVGGLLIHYLYSK